MSNNQRYNNYPHQNYPPRPPPQQQYNSNYPPNPQYYHPHPPNNRAPMAPPPLPQRHQNQQNYGPPMPPSNQHYRQNPSPPFYLPHDYYPNPPPPPQNQYQNCPPPPQNQNYPPQNYQTPNPPPPQNYPRQSAPPPQQTYGSSSTPPPFYPPCPQNSTQLHGLIIGRTKDKDADWMFYSAGLKEKGTVRIRREHRRGVEYLRIGQWIQLTIWKPNYQGEFILDRTNSDGYDVEFADDILPDPAFCSAKFFPSRANLDEGELVVMARFGVAVNKETRWLEFISYDIEFNHMVDDYNLIKSSHKHYDGRSFIAELQASTGGWIVLNVHEDPEKQLLCDDLKDAIVDFSVQFLEDCNPKLPAVMTGTGILLPLDNAPKPSQQQRQGQAQQHHVAGSVGQNQTSTSTGASSSTNKVPSSDASDVSVAATAVLGRQEAHGSHSKTTTTTKTTKTTSSSRNEEKSERSTEKSQKSTTKKKPEVFESDESEIDDDDKLETRGTHNIPQKEFLEDVAGKTYQRLQSERARKGEVKETALCTVVQKFDGMWLMYTAKKDVLNVLLYEKTCEGINEPLQLGQVAFFEILPRQNETQDELLPRAMYTHIAVNMKEVTPEAQVKIDRFKSCVRCFGGLVEMRVRIKLTEGNKVFFHYEDDEQIKSDDDRRFYYLKATNGVLVTIPCQRLVRDLNRDLSADFDLLAWVTHRKAVGNVSLHIGKTGEAYQKMKADGMLVELPPLCSHWQSGGKK